MQRKIGIVCSAVVLLASAGSAAAQGTVSFVTTQAERDAFDAAGNADNFLNGSEFQPVGTDGVQFILRPVTNLVGFPRFISNNAAGINFGGGGGSSLAFTFEADAPLDLESYIINDAFGFLNAPTFSIEDGGTVLSAGNDGSRPTGLGNQSRAFVGGVLRLEADTQYTFRADTTGAAVQAFIAGFNYTVVPTPASAGLLAMAGLAATRRRR
ncbi:MAG: hypothetical protein AAF747_01880 [Planctomycetota bacterium]